ncbi:MAG: biotin/lipoate A/B protein ligase family protein [Nitrospirota bacterium]
MITWRFIDSGPCDAACNMALDEAIALSVRKGEAPPTLRLYGWCRPSVSLGSFQKITDINVPYCTLCRIPIVRRPTGGRGILHGDELTYSFSAKNEYPFSRGLLDTYREISKAFSSALSMLGLEVEVKREREPGRNPTRSPLCFQSTSFGEISVKGKKLIGSAQKRWQDGFLQQGSIPYSIDCEQLEAVFKVRSKVNSESASRVTHYASRPSAMVGLKELIPGFNQEEFKACLRRSFERSFGITLADVPLSPQEQALAQGLLLEKYQDRQWTEGASGRAGSCSNTEMPKRA